MAISHRMAYAVCITTMYLGWKGANRLADALKREEYYFAVANASQCMTFSAQCNLLLISPPFNGSAIQPFDIFLATGSRKVQLQRLHPLHEKLAKCIISNELGWCPPTWSAASATCRLTLACNLQSKLRSSGDLHSDATENVTCFLPKAKLHCQKDLDSVIQNLKFLFPKSIPLSASSRSIKSSFVACNILLNNFEIVICQHSFKTSGELYVPIGLHNTFTFILKKTKITKFIVFARLSTLAHLGRVLCCISLQT